MSETKASEHYPRDLVRKSPPDGEQKGTMFDEFDEIENGARRLTLKNQLLYDIDWSLLVGTEEEVERLVETGFWQRDLIYHGCVVTSKAKSRPSIFKGYREVAATEPDSPERRWATVVPISEWDEWVEKITGMAMDFLVERQAEGHF
jgi:hypothetical protein